MFGRDEYVFPFDITMEDSGLVKVRNRQRDLEALKTYNARSGECEPESKKGNSQVYVCRHLGFV